MTPQTIDQHPLQHGLIESIGAAAASAGVEVFAHARDLGAGREVGYGADEPTVAASVFKVPVLVEYVRQVAAGELDPARRLTLSPSDAALGPTGLSVFSDVSEWSLRDIATSMITVSDNAATDVVTGLVGVDRVNATMRELGLPGTQLIGDCAALFATLAEDLGVDALGPNDGFTPENAHLVPGFSVSTPARTNRSTPRESTRLLELLWSDQAAPPEACAEARRILGLQVWPHRLSSGFPQDDVKISGKTGTIGIVRNEIGVVEFPDGSKHAIAVFLRSKELLLRNPKADRAIGTIARLLSDALG